MRGRNRLEPVLAFAFCLAAASGCSSERKLSHVDTRVPAAVSEGGESSSLRALVAQLKKIPVACPAEVRELLVPLSQEKVKYPPCPETLAPAFQAARAVLTLDESTSIESLLGQQCHLNARVGLPEALDSLMQDTTLTKRRKNEDGTGTDKADGTAAETGVRQREAVRGALIDLRTGSAALNEWVRNNGEYVFPEEQLEFFDRLVTHDACRMADQEVDLSYRTLHSLEELAGIEAEGEPQRARIGRFLNGVHKVIDRKIQEFFRR